MRRKLLIIFLIAAGLLLILSPFIKEGLIGRLTARYNSQGLTPGELAKNAQRKSVYQFSSIQPPSFTETVKSGLSVDRQAIIGRITIHSVGIRLPILKGTTTAHLLAGATTMRPDQQMGEGNYPLAGHHMREENLLFGPLMHLRTGARIVITDLRKNYTYQVTSKKIVSETDGAIINQTKEKRITLVTCDKPTRTPNRLIVIGKLIRVTAH
ncbi:MAG: class A sortase [Sporolactobacillus sp.]